MVCAPAIPCRPNANGASDSASVGPPCARGSAGGLPARLGGVARTSLREGIRALVYLGVVDVKNGEGMSVGQLDFRGLMGSLPHSLLTGRDDFLDLMEIRQTLEVLAASRAATRATDQDLAAMTDVLARMQAKVDAGHYSMAEDKEFHELILRAADSPLLTQFLGAISDLVWLIRSDLSFAGGPSAQGVAAHRAILDAIRCRDPGKAGSVMRHHLEVVRDRLRHLLDGAPSAVGREET